MQYKNKKSMKTIELKLASQNSRESYDNMGVVNGASLSTSYNAIIAEDDNSQFGTCTMSVSVDYYNNTGTTLTEDYQTAILELNAKIKQAFEDFNNAVTGQAITLLD